MIVRKYSSLLFLPMLLLEFRIIACENQTPSSNRLLPYPLVQLSAVSPQPKFSVSKYGEEPTNRVLPVDTLTEADYDDLSEKETDNDHYFEKDREYCSRLFKRDLKMLMSFRQPRQENNDDESEKEQYLFGLNYDPVKAVRPFFNMIGSAAARNSSGVDENYKKLPSNLKTEFEGFLKSLDKLIKTIRLLEDEDS